MCGLGKTGKVKVFENVQKYSKTVENCIETSGKKYRNVGKNWRVLDADCAEKYSHGWTRINTDFFTAEDAENAESLATDGHRLTQIYFNAENAEDAEIYSSHRWTQINTDYLFWRGVRSFDFAQDFRCTASLF